ncbi:hypothetical protein CORC01_05794 [Colletotrichum orchidophilum]|uniref:Uncharacterized protein n=1 Tax=Colletotrichum orchidophilum TaxID=1209926 RepID=A0A1G4BBX9_9PEZI|nr:uncharacterized protein CORC01_05794 [Colletotrichum orchidophilum]OHE98898.1 hypothetical protein CORC01_05794 [Colletotrichum orchidophilum]
MRHEANSSSNSSAILERPAQTRGIFRADSRPVAARDPKVPLSGQARPPTDSGVEDSLILGTEAFETTGPPGQVLEFPQAEKPTVVDQSRGPSAAEPTGAHD